MSFNCGAQGNEIRCIDIEPIYYCQQIIKRKRKMWELIYFARVIKDERQVAREIRNDREWENWLWPQGWVENVDDTWFNKKTINKSNYYRDRSRIEKQLFRK